jgi:hypothetical protein
MPLRLRTGLRQLRLWAACPWVRVPGLCFWEALFHVRYWKLPVRIIVPLRPLSCEALEAPREDKRADEIRSRCFASVFYGIIPSTALAVRFRLCSVSNGIQQDLFRSPPLGFAFAQGSMGFCNISEYCSFLGAAFGLSPIEHSYRTSGTLCVSGEELLV